MKCIFKSCAAIWQEFGHPKNRPPISLSHTIECVWERRTSMFLVLDTNLWLKPILNRFAEHLQIVVRWNYVQSRKQTCRKVLEKDQNKWFLLLILLCKTQNYFEMWKQTSVLIWMKRMYLYSELSHPIWEDWFTNRMH